jgi:membrane associated rhomboid family serine protease
MKIRFRYNAPVILTFTLISVAVLVADTLTGGAASKAAFTVFPGLDFRHPMTILRLFTHVIGHANWTHLMSNFSFILLVGPILEEKYGSLRTLAMMAVTALVTGLLASLVFRTGLQGASGVVFMFILLGSFTNSRQGEIPLTFVLVVVLFLAREVINAVAVRDNVAQFAHIAGGVIGAIFGSAATASTRRLPQADAASLGMQQGVAAAGKARKHDTTGAPGQGAAQSPAKDTTTPVP